jgi:hypothetical protein
MRRGFISVKAANHQRFGFLGGYSAAILPAIQVNWQANTPGDKPADPD